MEEPGLSTTESEWRNDPKNAPKRKNFLPNMGVHNGFSYVYSHTTVGGVMKSICKHYRRPLPGSAPCTGKAEIINGEYIETAEHNHIGKPNAADVKRFRMELRETIALHGGKNREIFDAIKKKHPKANDEPYRGRTMRVQKAKMNPPYPKNLAEYGASLEQEKYQPMLDYSAGHMTAKVLRDENDDVSVVFGDRTMFETILPNVEPGVEVFIDATFDSVPVKLNILQILEIQVCVFDHGVVIVHALMEKKTTEAYRAVFKYVFEELAPELNMRIKVHMDFEEAPRNAFREVVPEAIFEMCNFHFTQAVVKQAYKKKALKRERKSKVNKGKNEQESKNKKKNKKNEREIKVAQGVQRIITLLLALAFMPAKLIETLFTKIKSEIKDKDVENRMKKFLDYFNKQWIRRRPPSEWSVYKTPRRTNNAAESWNRTLHQKIGHKPGPWEFTRKLTDAQSRVRSDYDAIANGNIRYSGRWSDELNESKLRIIERKLKRKRYTPWMALQQTGHCVNFEKKYKESKAKITKAKEVYECKNDQPPGSLKIILKKHTI